VFQVDNLRSAAAKNAILALGDLFYGLQTSMDAEVPGSASILLKVCFKHVATSLCSNMSTAANCGQQCVHIGKCGWRVG
jgi:hypothetical protein